MQRRLVSVGGVHRWRHITICTRQCGCVSFFIACAWPMLLTRPHNTVVWCIRNALSITPAFGTFHRRLMLMESARFTEACENARIQDEQPVQELESRDEVVRCPWGRGVPESSGRRTTGPGVCVMSVDMQPSRGNTSGARAHVCGALRTMRPSRHLADHLCH